ncbi:MAG: 30S ribosomal protein S2 [archaeon]
MKQDKFLAFGVHIGTQKRRKDMEEFVYKIRADGLAVMNIQKVDERLQVAGRFLAKFKPEGILVVAARDYAQGVAKKFAETIGARSIEGRFMPGTFTNPESPDFAEADVIVVADPLVDRQAVNEAKELGLPIVAFCDTNNTRENVDLIIPGNNKGKKSIGMLYWALATYVLRERGDLQKGLDLSVTPEEFVEA